MHKGVIEPRRRTKVALALIPPAVAAAVLWQGLSGEPPAGTVHAPPAGPGTPFPAEADGWQASDIRWFPAESLFEAINGRAPFYEQFGVKGLWTAAWRRDTAEVDLFLYIMNSEVAAMGAFRGERPATARPLALGAEGWSDGVTCAARTGAYYLQWIPRDPSQGGKVAALATALIAALGPAAPDAAPSAEAPAIPPDHVVAGTEGVQAADAFGFRALQNVVYADCTVGTSRATWYVADGGPAALAAYTNELARLSESDLFRLGDAVGAEVFGEWEIAGVVGDRLRGVRAAPSREAALTHWQAWRGNAP